MLNDKLKKYIGPFILFYVAACGIVKVALQEISPLIIVVLGLILLVPISLTLIRARGNGIAKLLNISFVVLLDITFILLLMNVVAMEIYPTYMRAHERFFDASVTAAVLIFLLSGITGVLSKYILKK